MVDYKGFRALAIAYVELDTSMPVLGFNQGQYVSHTRAEKVYQDMRNIGIALNLKENRNTSTAEHKQYTRIPVSSAI